MDGRGARGPAKAGQNGSAAAGIDGDWEDNEGDIVTIRSGAMSVSDGTTLDLTIGADGSCSFSVQDQVFVGRLEEPDKMVWSDGAVWSRRKRPAAEQVVEGAVAPPDGPAEEGDAEAEAEAEALEAELRRFDREEAEREGEEELPSPLSSAALAARASQFAEAASSSSAAVPSRIEVVARHATEGFQVRVLLPKHAKFKHIKKALALRLGSEGIARSGLLTYKVGGRYRACKDEGLIGDVRQVLVACADFRSPGGGEAEANLSDGEVSAEESLDFLNDFDKEDESDGAATSAPSQAPKPPGHPRGGKPGCPELTREQAVSLQKDLLEAYKEHKFQQRLDSLDRIYGALTDSIEFKQERQELFLSAQCKVLPRYGFEGTLDGVFCMMGAMGAFIEDPEVVALAKQINKTLGIRSPPSTWGKLSKDCKQLDVDASDPDGSKAAAKRKQRPDMNRLVPPPADGEGPKSLLLPLVPPYAKAPPPSAPEPKAKAKPGGTQAPVEVSSKPGALDFEAYPAGRVKPYRLYVAGTWNDYKLAEMHWQRGLFVSPVTIGSEGVESFQLLKNGKWNATIYPSIPDASPLEEHEVCGPDSKGHGKNWTIGRFQEEAAAPGKQFAIIAALDKQGLVRLVHWQQMD